MHDERESALHAYFLRRVSEPRDIVCQLPLQQLLFFCQFLRPYFSCNFVAPRVLVATPSRHEPCQEKGHTGFRSAIVTAVTR